jgi:N-methylhydantoinase B
VRAGEIVRVLTTGGGGWGDPLEREPELVLRDVVEDKVSAAAARMRYGVVLANSADSYSIDAAATAKLRAQIKSQRTAQAAMIDRGSGYANMMKREKTQDGD